LGSILRYDLLESHPDALVRDALQFATEAHEGQVRKYTREPFINHPISVAYLVAGYDPHPTAIAAALLHDLVEDIEGWTQERVALKFSPTISELVWWVTKPSVVDYGGDKEARNRIYHENLRRAPRNAIIIKLADRLHNLLTLWDTIDEKQRRKVRETQDFYLPLAEHHILLIHEVEDALREVMGAWK